MNHKEILILTIVTLVGSEQCILAAIPAASPQEPNNPNLEIYLPRNATIKDHQVNLGQIAIIRGPETLAAKAKILTLGQLSTPTQIITIDRKMLLSRLACSGIPTHLIQLTGAKKTIVKKQNQIVSAEQLVNRAQRFLDENPSTASIAQYSLLRSPEDLILPPTPGSVTLSARLTESPAPNRANVRIIAMADEKPLADCDVLFRLRFNQTTAVTTADISAGTTISPDNVKIVRKLADYPPQTNWSYPYGLVARRPLPANTTLRSNMLTPAQPALVVNRDQTVIIKIQRPGLLVTAVGKALEKGRVGQFIKVQNIDSRKKILAKVNEDATVQPAF